MTDKVSKSALVRRKLKRVEGQIKGIVSMYEEGRTCLDVVQQIAAARSALGSIAKDILTCESLRCAAHPKDKSKLESTLKRLFEIG